MFKDFVNRETETSYILEQLKSVSEANKIFILFAESGIGKSRFAQKIIEESELYVGLKVRVVQTENTSFSSGFFLKRIAEELHALSLKDNTLDSLDQFLKKLPNKELKKDFWENVLKSSIRSSLPKFLRGIEAVYDRLFGRNQFNSRVIFDSGNNVSTNIYFHYIKYALNQKPLLLNIENVQLVDVVSLEKLLSIVRSVQRCTFLFEYTLSDTNSVDAAGRFGENFQTIAEDQINYIRLNKLAFKDFLQLVRHVNEVESEEVLKTAYADYDGNLRRLLDLNVLFSSSDATKRKFWNGEFKLLTEDATRLNISSLKPDDNVVLAVILVFGADMYLDTLSDVLRFNDQFNFISITDCISRLSSVHFLLSIDENYQIQTDHDYILESIKSIPHFNKYLLLAYRMIEKYYQSFLKDQMSKHYQYKSYKNLFSLYLRFDPDRAVQILDKIKVVAANYSNPSEAGSYLNELLKRLHNTGESISDTILLNFVNIYIYLGLYQNAYSLLDSLSSNAPKASLIFQAILLNRLDKHKTCIEFINEITPDKPQNRFELSMKIVLMLSYQSLDMINESKRVYQEILENKDLSKYYEFGYFLRNTDVLLPLKEGLESMKKSVDFFIGKNDIHVAHSRIAVSMQLARLGSLKSAMKELKEADSILRDKTMERHILFNNRAVIAMYSGDFSKEVISLLDLSLVTTTTPFDELVVKYNMLIFHANNDTDTYSVDSLVGDILRLIEVEPDLNEHRIAYYNIAYYYEIIGNLELHKHYKGLCSSVEVVQRKEFWEKRLAKKKNKSNEFLLNFDFHGGFLTPWHFEIDQLNF